MTKPATITARLAAALTSRRDSRPLYIVSVGHPSAGPARVTLTGRRGAEYMSVVNVHDGLHRFIDRPVASYKLAILAGGTVALADEASDDTGDAT